MVHPIGENPYEKCGQVKKGAYEEAKCYINKVGLKKGLNASYIGLLRDLGLDILSHDC